jgi:hypothetical protein
MIKMGLIKKLMKKVMKHITYLGGMIFYGIILVFTLVLQEFQLFNRLVISFGIIMGFSTLIKTLFFKRRPDGQEFNNIIEKIDAGSFPSVHAMRTVSLAMIFSAFFNDVFVSAFFVIMASIISYSRIHLKKHYFVDVLFGLVFGIIITLYVLAFF